MKEKNSHFTDKKKKREKDAVRLGNSARASDSLVRVRV